MYVVLDWHIVYIWVVCLCNENPSFGHKDAMIDDLAHSAMSLDAPCKWMKDVSEETWELRRTL